MGYCLKQGHGAFTGNSCPKCAAAQNAPQRPIVQPARLPVPAMPRAAVPNPVQAPRIHFDRIPMIDNRIKGVGGNDWDTYFSPHYREPNPVMDGIKQSLTEYWKIFSPIARSNFNPDQRRKLTDLRDVVGKWMRGPKPANDPLVPAMEALKRVVDRTLQAMPAPPPRKYHSLVCIGYKCVTGTFENPNDINLAKVQYTGAYTDRIDMNNKRDQLKKAITQALRQYQTKFSRLNAEEHKDTLKIFMAPEFYFRGRQGGYDMAVVGEILPEMRDFTKSDDYKHWLFVLGTAIAATRINPTCSSCHGVTELMNDPKDPLSHRKVVWCRKCKKEETASKPKMMLDNFAVVQKGGENTDANAYLIQKEFMSRVDYRRPTLTTDWDNPANRQVNVRGLEAEAIPSEGSSQPGTVAQSLYKDERMGGSVFSMDGISFGVEVCRDHLRGRLKNSDNSSQLNIQIQLIPSAGVEQPVRAHFVAPIVFNVDGTYAKVELVANGVDVPLSSGGDLCISARITIPI